MKRNIFKNIYGFIDAILYMPLNFFDFIQIKITAARAKKYLAELQQHLAELQAYFPRDIMPSPLANLAPYPLKIFGCETTELCAYQITFLAHVKFVPKIECLTSEFFPTIVKQDEKEILAKNSMGESINCVSVPAFSGRQYIIFTNSAHFIKALDMFEIYPPQPWDSYPDENPDEFRATQGDREYWWHDLWHPFWKTLTKEKKLAYFENNKEHTAWMEYIQRHNVE